MKTIKILFIALILLNFSIKALSKSIETDSLSINHSHTVSECIKDIHEKEKRFYFNADYSLTSPSCASYYRVAEYDSIGNFFKGPFQDYRFDSVLLTEGTYVNGHLDGKITIRYMNGNIWQKGAYKDGLMVGKWEYFYPDGKPMYNLNLIGDKIILQTVWDQSGNKIVEDGNGIAVIFRYNSFSDIGSVSLNWRGKVKKGLIEGRWKMYYFNTSTKLNQVYNKGKFIKGYNSGRFFNTYSFFGLGQEQALINAEVLKVGACGENPTNATAPFYPLGNQQLKLDIYSFIDNLDIEILENSMVELSFNVSATGDLSDFKATSSTGLEEYFVLALKELGPWAPAIAVNNEPVDIRTDFTFQFVTKIEREMMSKGTQIMSDDKLRNEFNKVEKDAIFPEYRNPGTMQKQRL